MANDARIVELVEEALSSQLTPEQVCARSPELLADVKACLAECRDLDVAIDDLFPSTLNTSHRSAPRPRPPLDARLPSIPGYDVLKVLGRGGSGVVYRVRHHKLDRVVALKMLLSGEYASAAELTRFMQESRAEAGVRHPNIVQVYDVGQHDGLPYFTMEYAEGGNLAQKLPGKPQSPRAAAALVATLARAVHVAHQSGIVHRDLKPGNVLLAVDGTPKISDFGLAQCPRPLEGGAGLTRGGVPMGTPSYMAPEQVLAPAAVPPGPAVDIYALGAILYEMLTGRPPFHAATGLETQRQVLSDEPVRPSRLNPKIPRDLETICLKCLNKLPSGRYTSAAALADDLDRFLRLEPIKARPVGLSSEPASGSGDGRRWR
jgi:serine/threonine-protein kinase